MFIGHFAVALAAKKAAPKTSLATLFIATQFVDMLWPIFLLLGLEHVRIDPGNTVVTPMDFYDYPISHSLAGAIGWSLLFGAFYYFRRKLSRAAVVVALVVFSHWLLDLLTHRPDLPLLGNESAKFGLGLWNSFWGTFIVEFGLFAAGAYLYITTTKAKNKTGTYSLAFLFAFLTIIHLANFFGPPPPSVEMVALAGNLGWLFALIPWWVERNRTLKNETTTENKI